MYPSKAYGTVPYYSDMNVDVMASYQTHTDADLLRRARLMPIVLELVACSGSDRAFRSYATHGLVAPRNKDIFMSAPGGANRFFRPETQRGFAKSPFCS